MKISFKYFLFVVFFSAMGGLSGVSQAAIDIEPASFKLTLAKGERFTGRVTISNSESQAVTLHVEPEYWYQGTCNRDLSAWLKANPASFQLAANSEQTVTLQFAAPEELKGECMVMVFFAQEKIGTDISIRPRFGIPLYIRSKQTESIRGEILRFEENPAEKNDFFLDVKNGGNVHFLPYGFLLAKAENGEVLQKEIRFDQPIFPDQTSRMNVSLDRTLTLGKGPVEVHLYLSSMYALENKESGRDLQVLTAQCRPRD